MGLDGKDTVTSSMISSSSSSASLPLEGRVAIVTGGSRGIGRAISVHLRSLGAKLVINYASNSTLANLLATQLNNNNNNNTVSVDSLVAITVQADVSNPDQVKLLFDRAEEAYGCPPHIIVCCAGVLDPNYPTIANTPLQDWDRTFNINTRGTFICCQEAAKRLKQGGGGRIIVISSSVVGSLPPGYGSYTASKAAVEAMTKILAKELKGTGITANCVAPGAVATDLFYEGKSEEAIKRMIESCPMGRLGETDDVAPIVGMLAADAGGWINGQVVRVNGGSVI